MLDDWDLGLFCTVKQCREVDVRAFPMPSDASINRWVRLIAWRYGSESPQTEKETENKIF